MEREDAGELAVGEADDVDALEVAGEELDPYTALELPGVFAFGMPHPFPPAMGCQAGSSPGTQSETSGQFAARAGLYAPFGYVGHPFAGYAFWLASYCCVPVCWDQSRLLGRGGLVNQLSGTPWYAGCAKP